MIKKKRLLANISSFLLAAAPITVYSLNSMFFLGEPKLPKNLKK